MYFQNKIKFYIIYFISALEIKEIIMSRKLDEKDYILTIDYKLEGEE